MMDTGTASTRRGDQMNTEECSDYQPDPYKLIAPFMRERQEKLEAAQKLLESDKRIVVFIRPVR